MPYRLLTGGSVEDDVRRVVDEQLTKAIDELADQPDGPHEAVHDARKKLKKSRAVLRLVRGNLGGVYKRENVRLRDVARGLSEARDAEALIETFDKLVEAFGDQLDDGVIDRLQAALVRRRDDIVENQVDLDDRIDQAIDELKDARKQSRQWRLSGKQFAPIEDGLKRTYARARDAMKEAYKEETTEAFHEWRKRVKYHRYHTRLLQDVWKKSYKARRKELKRLSDYLGDEHDLAVLVDTLRAEADRFDNERDVQTVLDLADRRRGELRAAARPLGRKLFADKPKRLARRWRQFHKSNRSKPKPRKHRPLVAVE